MKATDSTMRLKTNYAMTVEFEDSTIVVTQRQIIYIDLKEELTYNNGNLFDKTIVDIYRLTIDASGRLQTTRDTDVKDNLWVDEASEFSNFFHNVNDYVEGIQKYVQKYTPTHVDILLSTAQNYVFPGGKTFVFKNAHFSPYQDLIAYISYQDVTKDKQGVNDGAICSFAAPRVKASPSRALGVDVAESEESEDTDEFDSEDAYDSEAEYSVFVVPTVPDDICEMTFALKAY